MRRYGWALGASLLINLLILAWISHTWVVTPSVMQSVDMVFEGDDGSLFQTQDDGDELKPSKELKKNSSGGSLHGEHAISSSVGVKDNIGKRGDEDSNSNRPKTLMPIAKADHHTETLNKNNDSTEEKRETAIKKEAINEPEKSASAETKNGSSHEKSNSDNQSKPQASGSKDEIYNAMSKESGNGTVGNGKGSSGEEGNGANKISNNSAKDNGDKGADGDGTGGNGAKNSLGNSTRTTQPPVLVKFVEPEYPQKARENGWEGRAVVEVSIDSQGKVKDVTLVESSGYDVLDQAAIKAAWRLRYKPATREGLPVPSKHRHPFRFQLKGE